MKIFEQAPWPSRLVLLAFPTTVLVTILSLMKIIPGDLLLWLVVAYSFIASIILIAAIWEVYFARRDDAWKKRNL